MLTAAGDDAGMPMTIAIIVNAVLVIAVLAALARVVHLPFRLKHESAEEQPAELELERAA